MSGLAMLESNGRVGRLVINRPDARNALSIELLRALRARVDGLANRDDLTVLVLTGAGKAFCAGMDLKAVLGDGAAARELLMQLAELTISIRSLPMVVVARVNGAAIGGGCGLACACDIAVTHADSKMGFPEIDLGVCPAVVAPWLVRKIGAGRARRVLLSGGLMSGAEAHAIGIVDQVVPSAADLDAGVDELVSRLALGGPDAVRATKALLNEVDGSRDADVVRRGAELSAEVLATADAQARLRAKLGV